jgi:NitT/TauT family transport system permease protein
MATSTSAAQTVPVTRPPAIGWARLPVGIRRGLIGAVLVVLWHFYAVHKGPLLIATPWQTAQEFWDGWREGTLAHTTWTTLSLLLRGVGIGAAVAALLTAFAALSKVGEDLLILLTSLLNPLPGVAVLPLAMLLFGIGETALLFVIANATIWPIAIAVTTGFKTTNATLVAVGRNIGLSRVRVITDVLAPAALPSVISGIKTAWAFGWRTIIAAELVFGVAGEESGLGNYIDNARQYLLTPQLFAGLLTIMLLGVLFETLFGAVERRTIIRWGMKTS